MKKLVIQLIILIISVCILGCAPKKMSENEFEAIWKEYIKSEFIESFDEKQSKAQRKGILTKILKKYDIDVELFMIYFKKNHKKDYNKIFIE